jgi:hypothetical protein
LLPPPARKNLKIALDRHAVTRHPDMIEQRSHIQAIGDFAVLAVDRDSHSLRTRRGTDWRNFRARAHREAEFVPASLPACLNHQRQVPFSKWRHGKLNSHAALVIAGALVTSIEQGAFNPRLYLDACLRLLICSATNFHLQ